MFKAFGLTFLAGALATAPTPPTAIDLTGPFHTRTPWRFTATQGPAVKDFVDDGGTEPGEIRLCLSHDGAQGCEPALLGILGHSDTDSYSGPHFLKKAEIDQPDARPLLLIQSAGLPSGDGDYGIETSAFRYDRRQDRFISAYEHGSEHNRNGNVRYVTDGPLRGDFISVDATEDAPFGYWVVVNRLGADDTYHAVLRYRSATHYGDGNPLAVIDSEMPNIEERLGLWRPGRPLPLPPGPCVKPHLKEKALWCQ
jgi:hypothetical protein